MTLKQTAERISSWKKRSGLSVGEQNQAIIYDDSSHTPLRYKEGQTANVQWKWVHLPMKSQDRTINKLLIYNDSTEELKVNFKIQYEMIERGVEIVYYSPSQESLIVHDKNCYSLFGGLTSQGSSCSYSTTLAAERNGGEDIELHHMQPIVQFSHGWSLKYQISLTPGQSGYFYEWEMKNGDLLWLEDAHAQYHSLLGSYQASDPHIVRD
ncbi:hypothetical protein [Alteribacter populi]|uniref:hypothetical protein n=1 Tax=Alteribacter populi TaxID=2011011 RepID=UPI000BBA9E71|nr:hypothetical protein [Alteribacter populi]